MPSRGGRCPLVHPLLLLLRCSSSSSPFHPLISRSSPSSVALHLRLLPSHAEKAFALVPAGIAVQYAASCQESCQVDGGARHWHLSSALCHDMHHVWTLASFPLEVP